MPILPQEPQQVHLNLNQDPSSLEPVESQLTSDPNESRPCARKLASRYCIEACVESLSWRGWLCYLACLLVIIMIIGIVCSAHVYYHDMGGQGWLKKRRSQERFDQVQRFSEVCLPSRPLEPYNSMLALSPRMPAAVPWYTCGDQQNSCEAYAHPEICCPQGMICRPTTHTISGIYCCNGTLSHSNCRLLRAHARCRPNYFECPGDMGGGCCPNSTACYKNQCIPVYKQPSSVRPSNGPTVTPWPAAPVPREGEIAQGSRLIISTFWRAGYPFSALGFLILIGVVMGML
ncbi:hypothetical protein BCIN_14g02040 [Botrytis cinerea B05.10]|uniref:Uncharacterized protein n=2 Tax=Botryotinia fuckeliana TaxID=40559 RepID=A0A384K305_BOTFB|nr:hypothetical protein BCIN_14g02040 [Botrytis cinerea B05.10]ATZ57014.1 hypothetical protein BCIN_14g02040 [Botrytis cinerea B05.10]CCD44298.1 hypothetical protein BofuT4_P058780.1 [Botrytis cinerea T4]